MWPTKAKEAHNKLKTVQVKHVKQQFTKKLKKKPTPTSSKIGGTQLADSSWKSLKAWIPKHVNTTFAKSRAVNPELLNYVWSWQFPYHNRGNNRFPAIAKAMRSGSK